MIKEKQLLLDEITQKIDPSVGFILTSYSTINANAMADFREKLVSAGGSFFAVKKRVFRKAAQAMDLKYELGELEGHLGLVVVEGSFLDATKALCAFSGENKEAIKILGGHFEGKKCSAGDVEQISKLPNQAEMRAQFLGLLEAPMSQTLATLEAIITSVIYCLDNKTKKES